jgi:hypothetical protein
MAAMEAALATIESLDEEEHFTYTNVAKIYNVDRSTLSRRHTKVQAPKADQAINQQLKRRSLFDILSDYQIDGERLPTHKRDDYKFCKQGGERGGGKRVGGQICG